MSKSKSVPGDSFAEEPAKKKPKTNKFHVVWRNTAQKMAYNAYKQHDVLFLTGPAGTGKTHCAMSYAIESILRPEKDNRKTKIVLTRPIVEAGESLGYLPGDLNEKTDPYMMPCYDIFEDLVNDPDQKQVVGDALEVIPLAYMRGRTFKNAVCIFDEAQNATYKQLMMFLTRFQEGSKLIITGDPDQSDLCSDKVDLVDVMARLEKVIGIATIEFTKDHIVRHPLVSKILEKLEE
jgi:phosphate starvation-inducible PhoH-like protein